MAAENKQTLFEIQKQNVELQTKINLLKAKLGVTPAGEDIDRRKFKQIFDLFDRDGNGWIDKQEFEILAFECGVDIVHLTENGLDQAFHALNPSGDGRILFDDFYRWLKTEKDQVDRPADGFGLLRLRLLSKSWSKQLEVIKETARKAREEKAVVVPLPLEAGSRRNYLFQAGVGHFDEAKSSINFSIYDDDNEAKAISAQVNCPDEVTSFAHIDFAIKPDANDMTIGELCGMIEVVLDAIPWQNYEQYHHSHTVDVHESENGTRYLRLSFFCRTDILGFITSMLIGQQDDNARSALRGFIKLLLHIEFPFSLADFKQDMEKPFTSDDLKFKLKLESFVDRRLEAESEALVDRLPPALSHALRQNLATIRFIRNMESVIQFGNVSDLLSHVPDSATGAVGGIKQYVEQLGQYPAGITLSRWCEVVRTAAESQKELYNCVLDSLTGLSRIHVQIGDSIVRLDVKGFDIVQFLSPLQ